MKWHMDKYPNHKEADRVYSICGLKVWAVNWITKDPKKVTCKHCLRIIRENGAPKAIKAEKENKYICKYVSDALKTFGNICDGYIIQQTEVPTVESVKYGFWVDGGCNFSYKENYKWIPPSSIIWVKVKK